MECLIPPCLAAIREIRWNMENSQSVRESVKAFSSASQTDIANQLRSWLLRQQRTAGASTASQGLSPHQKALFSLLERGLLGQPILESLKALEEEVLRAAMLELDSHIAQLPFLSMIPLFLFQFPAYLLLLMGPLLNDVFRDLGGVS